MTEYKINDKTPPHSRAPCPSQPVLPICEVTLTYKIGGDPK